MFKFKTKLAFVMVGSMSFGIPIVLVLFVFMTNGRLGYN
jgi:hypothetical protein